MSTYLSVQCLPQLWKQHRLITSSSNKCCFSGSRMGFLGATVFALPLNWCLRLTSPLAEVKLGANHIYTENPVSISRAVGLQSPLEHSWVLERVPLCPTSL